MQFKHFHFVWISWGWNCSHHSNISNDRSQTKIEPHTQKTVDTNLLCQNSCGDDARICARSLHWRIRLLRWPNMDIWSYRYMLHWTVKLWIFFFSFSAATFRIWPSEHNAFYNGDAFQYESIFITHHISACLVNTILTIRSILAPLAHYSPSPFFLLQLSEPNFQIHQTNC